MRDHSFRERSTAESAAQFADPLPDVIERHVALLRAEPALRDEWRAQTLRRATARPARRVTLSLPAAVAAAVICALVGGAVALLASHPRDTARPAIATTAAGN